MKQLAQALILCASAWSFASPAGAQTLTDPRLQWELVATPTFSNPTMAFIGDDDFLLGRLLSGEVIRVTGGVVQPAPVLDVDVHYFGFSGLLSVSVDPDLINNRFVYLYHSESPTGDDTNDPAILPLGLRLYRYRWDGAALVEPVLLVDIPVEDPDGLRHSGGPVVFGPDDRLYLLTGDLDRLGKLQNVPAGPDPQGTGVIQRLSTVGRPVADNPFYDANDPRNPMGRYYAYGIRNTFGAAFDPLSGDLWTTENGDADFDEINRVVPGFNSGWLQIMGPDALDPEGTDDLWVYPGSQYSDPELSFEAPIGITAIGFIESPKLGCDLQYDMIGGDFNCHQLYHYELNPTRTILTFEAPELQDLVVNNASDVCGAENSEIVFGTGNWGTITDIETGADGLLYLVSNSSPGRVFRIRADPQFLDDVDGDGVDAACDCDPADATAYGAPSEVPRLRISGSSPTLLGWNSQTAVAGVGTTSTVITGTLTALRNSGDFSAACSLASNLSEPRWSDVSPDPLPADGHYYLVRSGNSCAVGSYGDASLSPDPRDVLDLAVVSACP